MLEWRTIPGFSRYEVSESGHVRSERGEIKQRLKHGHPIVSLARGGGQIHRRVAVLVAMAFIGPGDPRKIRYKDDDWANTHWTNLEYRAPKSVEIPDLPGESWVPIPGYVNYYWASSLGRIKSRRRVLSPAINKSGYERVNLSKNGRQRTCLVHRLILMAFEGPSDLLALHKDGDKRNNHLDNLYYGTVQDNARDAVEMGYRPRRTSRSVIDDTGRKYNTLREAATACGIASGSISRAIREGNRAGGHFWRYNE